MMDEHGEPIEPVTVKDICASLRKIVIEARANPPAGISPGRFMASMIAIERGLAILEEATEGDADSEIFPLFELKNISLRRLE